ncbi:MAG: hypothetical protein LBG62_07145 [Candidatus Methanoplasma sp.]|jgi:hypothetical protein|nr:hypothetical protein [Candidatus Methanoplasma sp.]
MYAIVACLGCRRHRIADRSAASSACPFCGRADEHRLMRSAFESGSQEEARAVLAEMTGFVRPPPAQKTLDSDPLSSLAFRYERCRDPEERATLLAKGLTEIFGTFDEADIAKIDPRSPGKILKAMSDHGIAYEVGYGRFKA